MSIMRLAFSFVLLIALIITGASCTQPNTSSQDENQKIAEKFVKEEATFQFDGIPETLKVTGATTAGNGWQYTIEFSSRHGGYGNRSGQALDLVITHHTAELTVQSGGVTSAVMDGQWDMINQQFDVEIKPAPIDEVNVYLMKSNPPQIGVYIKGGLPDGCTTFHDIETIREGNVVNIKVNVQRPRGRVCPAVYTSFERNVNLGIDFDFGTTYTLNVNDYTTTFEGTLMKGEGFAIYLTREDIPPEKMEMLSQVGIADQPILSTTDIVSYDPQTHEIKLTDQAFKQILDLEVPVQGRSFLVSVNSAPVYWGAFWTPISSISFSGVTIMKPLGSQQESKTITLALGYPSPSFYGGKDPRNNSEVIESLDKAGKIINKQLTTSIENLPHSFKGYELYSWLEDEEWNFTLITGTNRTKTIDEITSNGSGITETGWVQIHVEGVQAIKDTLARLPEGEFVSWCDELHIGQTIGIDLKLPPDQIVKIITQEAEECKLNISVSGW